MKRNASIRLAMAGFCSPPSWPLSCRRWARASPSRAGRTPACARRRGRGNQVDGCCFGGGARRGVGLSPVAAIGRSSGRQWQAAGVCRSSGTRNRPSVNSCSAVTRMDRVAGRGGARRRRRQPAPRGHTERAVCAHHAARRRDPGRQRPKQGQPGRARSIGPAPRPRRAFRRVAGAGRSAAPKGSNTYSVPGVPEKSSTYCFPGQLGERARAGDGLQRRRLVGDDSRKHDQPRTGRTCFDRRSPGPAPDERPCPFASGERRVRSRRWARTCDDVDRLVLQRYRTNEGQQQAVIEANHSEFVREQPEAGAHERRRQGALSRARLCGQKHRATAALHRARVETGTGCIGSRCTS